MSYDDERTKFHNVLGHTCDGFKEHLKAATYQCIPEISEEGHIQGCDDTNTTQIKYCPYCGEKLPDTPNEEGD